MATVRLHVVKPFRFSSHGKSERFFEVGDYLLDPANENDKLVLKNDWIRKGADGCIELPEQTVARLQDQVVQHRNLVKHHTAMAEEYTRQLKELGVKPAEEEAKA